MKLRIFALLTCLILSLSVIFVACNKQEDIGEDSDTETSVTAGSESDSKSDTELDIGESNQAQGDRENEETTKEYLDYYKEVNDDKIMHVTFE